MTRSLAIDYGVNVLLALGLTPEEFRDEAKNWMAYFFPDRVMKQEIAEIARRRARLLGWSGTCRRTR